MILQPGPQNQQTKKALIPAMKALLLGKAMKKQITLNRKQKHR
jgi:hypothetical protein